MPQLGRLHQPDARNWPASLLVTPDTPIKTKMHSMFYKELDQGATGTCVGHAGKHFMLLAPVIQTKPNWHPTAIDLYLAAAGRDIWSQNDNGDLKFGTSVLALMKALQDMGLITNYLWANGVTQLARWISEYGPAVIGVNWYDCLVPGQRVLTSDIEWKPIEKLNVGDELIGFDTPKIAGTFKRSYVTALGKVVRPVYEVRTSRSTIIGSEGHLVVKCDRSKGREWIKLSDIKPGDELAYFMDPFEQDTSWEAGWLSGFFDGEGSVAAGLVSAGQKEGVTLTYLQTVAKSRGFSLHRKLIDYNGVAHVHINGSYAAGLQFLGKIRPVRLLPKAPHLWEGRNVKNKQAAPVFVREVKSLGMEEVISIGTSTGTLMVEGLFSHNSFFTPNSGGVLAITGASGVAGGHALAVRGWNTKTGMFRVVNSWGPMWGNGGQCWIPGELMERLMQEDGEIALPTEIRITKPA